MLSAIIPNYNHAAYLPQAISALLAQTRPADEIIVIDDASEDDSVAVAGEIAARHASVRVLRNPENLGVVGTLNRGLREARHPIVYCGAADDLTYPTLFERGLPLLEAYPRAALFSARSDILDSQGINHGVMQNQVPLAAAGFLDPAAVARALMRDDGWFMGNTVLYRLEPLLASGGFPADVGSFNDGYVCRLLALQHGACYSPEVLAAWRRLEGGFAWSQTVDSRHWDWLTAAVVGKMRRQEPPFPPGYADRWRRRYIFGAQRFALTQRRRQAAKQGSAEQAKALAREIAGTLCLFLRLRPFDVVPVTQRRLRYLLGMH
jgi:glycosyltransferase involved in cell wall biosynthesis